VIFGDRQELAIEIDRLGTPANAVDLQDNAVWGALAIWVAGQNLSRHWRHGTDRVREDLHIPLLPLARWANTARAALRYQERSPLGAGTSPHEELDRWSDGPPPTDFSEDAWLDRRDAWWSDHFTGAATTDVVAPSIGIVRNDDRAIVSWRIPRMPRPDRTFVRPTGADVVAWSAVAGALDEFVAAVADWAAPAYRLVPEQDPTARALEYYTGLPEHEIPRFGFLPEAMSNPAMDPLAQVVRDLSYRTSTGPAHESIVGGVRSAAVPAARAWWDLRHQLVPAPGRSFESDGYAGAQAARSVLGLDGEPIHDVEDLLRSVDIEVCADSPAAHSDRMLVAGTASGRAVTMILANARTAKPWVRRFELARALGHLLLDQARGEAIGAASGPQAVASRRRRAGAFAAEILLPTSALEAASEGMLDGILEGNRFAQLLDRFGVGASAAAFQLWNQHLLSSTEIRDDLIASV
jgi:hypothetical protein